MSRDPRKHTIPPAPPVGAPERYECKPYACMPDVTDQLARATVTAEATWLPNDRLWVWTCAHGRPHYLQWHPSITTAEMMEWFRASDIHFDDADSEV